VNNILGHWTDRHSRGNGHPNHRGPAGYSLWLNLTCSFLDLCPVSPASTDRQTKASLLNTEHMHNAGSLLYLAITSSHFLFAHLLYENSPLSQPAHIRTPHNRPEESPKDSR